MPTKLTGGDRRDTFSFPDLSAVVLGQNLRQDLGTEEEMEAFARDIAENGQIQDGVVRRDAQGRAVLVSGFRRFAAIQRINRKPSRYGLAGPMPFRAKFTPLTEEEALVVNLRENLERKQLSPIDLAFAARNLERLGWERSRVAGALSCSPSRVLQYLGLLDLPPETREMVHRGTMPEATARAMTGLPPEEIHEATQAVKGGEKPARVKEKVQAKKRAAGTRQARALPELRTALRKLTADQAVLLLAWLDGEPGLHFEDIEWGPVVGEAAQAWMEARAHGELEAEAAA